MAPGLAAQGTDDEAAVRQVVTSLFASMKQGDADGMAALMHEEVRLVSTTIRDGVPLARVVGVDGWLQSVGSSERELDEQIYDVEVRVSGSLAMVWTRYDLFVDGLAKAGWILPKPSATFFLWARVPTQESSMEFAKRLLERARVVITPGVGFGPSGEGYVRISLTVPTERIQDAIARISKAL